MSQTPSQFHQSSVADKVASVLRAQDDSLAPWAVHAADSGGRLHVQGAATDRNEFQRDTARVIHSAAFRRLQYKTQVFTNMEGDLFRTRLTHSMEVAQVSKAVARSLRLNEDLAETLGLAHDLGHAPFGHLGQDVLEALMKKRGGDFEHNLHGLRIVDKLEKRYADFDGLNLLYATREGILKHCSLANAKLIGEIGERFLNKRSASLEAQVVDWCDALAYTHSDLEDGLREKILLPDQVKAGLPRYAAAIEEVKKRHKISDESDPRVWNETINLMMKEAISDLITSSSMAIEASGVRSLEDVRAREDYLVGFSREYEREHKMMKKFLYKNMYTHANVSQTRALNEEMLETVFLAFERNPKLMGQNNQDDSDMTRAICDHVAGMTDRHIVKEFKKLQDMAPSVKSVRKLRA